MFQRKSKIFREHKTYEKTFRRKVPINQIRAQNIPKWDSAERGRYEGK